MARNLYGESVCSPLWGDVRGTELAAEHQAPGNPVAQEWYKLQVHSGGCKAVCLMQSLEHNSRTSKDWSRLLAGTVLQHTDVAVAASVSGTAVFVAAVVVQWLPAARPVTAADKPSTQPSAAASAPVSALSAFVATYPAPAPVGAPSRGVVLASPLKMSELRASDPI